MNRPVEPMLRGLAPALDRVHLTGGGWPELWARVNAVVQRRTPLWPVLASGTLCLALFLGSTVVGVMLGVTPTAAAQAAPTPIEVSQVMTPDETQSVRAGVAATSTPAPVALPDR
ncbi:MAG TPA: hypothetical protein PLC98_09115 [Anaerolineales bacterium]|nr:hypothetical protein [Anaerolineales bacterium]